MFITFNYKPRDKVITSAVRRGNLVTTIKAAKRALEVRAIMVTGTKFNIT